MLSLTYIAIIALDLLFLFLDKNPISLRQVFYVFGIIFFGIAGYIQYVKQYELAPMYLDLNKTDYLNANFIILLSIINYELVYWNIYRQDIKGSSSSIQNITITAKKYSLFSFFSITVLFFLYLNSFSIENIVLRGGDGTRVELSQTLGLLTNSIRFVFMSVALFYYISSNKNTFFALFFVIVFVLLCLPTSVQRLRILPLYLPLLAIVFPRLAKRKYVISFSIVFFTIVFFPLFGLTRLNSETLTESLQAYEYAFSTPFSTLDYDSYKTLVYVVAQDVVTNGKQLLTCILFWVPRSMWPDKAVGSGAFIAGEYDLGLGSFSNISMNYLGEGYINFGYMGILIFVTVLAVLSAMFDKYYWVVKKGNTKDPFTIYYYSSVGFLFFILRGDMLSGIAYYCGMITYIYLTIKICFHITNCPAIQNDPTPDLIDTSEKTLHADAD